MPLNTRVTTSLTGTVTKAFDLASATVPLKYETSYVLANGTAANQADLIWHDQRSIAASATDSLDLAGVLTDPFGVTITFARIKAVLVKAASANTNNVNVTRPATNGVPLFLAAGDGVPVRPGGTFLWIAPDVTGIAVTAGTGDLLDIVNSGAGTSVSYDVVVVGASA